MLRLSATLQTSLERRFFGNSSCFRRLTTAGTWSGPSWSDDRAPSGADAFNAELERVFGGAAADADPGGSGGGGGGGGFDGRLTAAGAPLFAGAAGGAPFADARGGSSGAACGVASLSEVLDDAPLELFILLAEKGALEWPSGRLLRAVQVSPREVAHMPGVGTALLRRLHALGVLAVVAF